MNNDLISRSALLKTFCNECGTGGRCRIPCVDYDQVANAPAVDVEVVRCKDCMHRGIVTECPMCYTEYSYDEDYGYDYWDVDKTVDDGFCHCGEIDAEVERC